MAFEPDFRVTAKLLQTVEAIAALRERIAAATVQVAWIPALQKDARVRNTHSSTAIEGNPLTLEQVRQLAEGRPLSAVGQRSQREVLNYFAGLVTPDQIPPYLASMDVLAHLSRREGLARALPQALAAGRPVVSYDCDGAKEICLNGETGFLIPPGDLEQLSARLLQWPGMFLPPEEGALPRP